MKRYLLDTHVLIWALTRRSKLKPHTLRILQQEEIHVSALTFWEILTKRNTGKLQWPLAGESLCAMVQHAGAKLLPLHAEHVESGLALDLLHTDPIDRMLVGTARIEGMILLTRDAEILQRAKPLLGPLLMEA